MRSTADTYFRGALAVDRRRGVHRPAHRCVFNGERGASDRVVLHRASVCWAESGLDPGPPGLDAGATHPDVRRPVAQSARRTQNQRGNCPAHGRRQFIDVAEPFPEQCRHVLEKLGEVYKNDAFARQRNLSPEACL